MGRQVGEKRDIKLSPYYLSLSVVKSASDGDRQKRLKPSLLLMQEECREYLEAEVEAPSGILKVDVKEGYV